jgi:urease accessory protein
MSWDRFKITIVTNNICTKEDANYRKSRLDIPNKIMVGVEMGGCPHTVIRDNIFINQKACKELEKEFNRKIICRERRW